MQLTEKIYAVIEQAYPMLSTLQDNFFIIGSAALILSNINITNTADIDILTSNRDANLLKKAWKEKQVSYHIPARSDLFRSNFSRYTFGVLDIEILGALEVQKNNKWTPLTIEAYTIISKNKMCIKIPTIQEQERILTWFGRNKDIAKLELIAKYKAEKLGTNSINII